MVDESASLLTKPPSHHAARLRSVVGPTFVVHCWWVHWLYLTVSGRWWRFCWACQPYFARLSNKKCLRCSGHADKAQKASAERSFAQDQSVHVPSVVGKRLGGVFVCISSGIADPQLLFFQQKNLCCSPAAATLSGVADPDLRARRWGCPGHLLAMSSRARMAYSSVHV